MKVKIGEQLLTGTPEEILREFQSANFHADSFETLAGYIEHMRGYCERVTERPCPVPERGSRNEKANALLRHLAGLGALEISEDEDGR